MAYMSQEKKAALAPKIKEILKKYGIKGSIAVHNHSTLVVNIKSGAIDFIKNYNDTVQNNIYARRPDQGFRPIKDSMSLNPYWYQEHFTGKALAFLKELFPAMNAGNYDKSDIQTDYFCVGWYVDVNVGDWNKPYIVTA